MLSAFSTSQCFSPKVTRLRFLASWRAFRCYTPVHLSAARSVPHFLYLLPPQTEETPEELNHRLIMLPDQPVKLRWDVAISMVCVLVAILSPYRMAFAHIDARSWLVFDAVVDVLFVFGKADVSQRIRVVSRRVRVCVFCPLAGVNLPHMFLKAGFHLQCGFNLFHTNTPSKLHG